MDTPSAIGVLRSLSIQSSLLSAPAVERYGKGENLFKSLVWQISPDSDPDQPSQACCQPGDPAERSWGCFTSRQYCSQERGAFTDTSATITDEVENYTDDWQPSAPEGVEDVDHERADAGAATIGCTDLNEQLKMSFAKLRRFVPNCDDTHDDENDANDDDDDMMMTVMIKL